MNLIDKLWRTWLLVVLPQIIAALAFMTPFAFAEELPSNAEGNAKLVHGAANLLVGFFLVLMVLPIVYYLLGLFLGRQGRRGETAAASFAFSLAGFLIPLLIAPVLGLRSPVQAFLIVWLATNLLALLALANHEFLRSGHQLDAEPVMNRKAVRPSNS